MRNILDSRQLLAFTMVARRGSFTRAAKELFLTQSAISHAMKALESDVGCRLIDRVGKRVMLTQSGEQFLRHAERILREMEAARGELDALANWGHGRLRVGASTTTCQYILPAVLREFKQSFPKCVIRIEPGDHARQMELLRAGEIDLAISLNPEGESEFAFEPLFEDELRFHVAPMHPWAKAGRMLRETVSSETFIMYNQTSYTFRLVSDFFRAEKIALNDFIELGSMEAIKELVKIGVGVGILAPWIAREELRSGALVSLPISRRRLRRRWGVLYLRGHRLPLAEETFVGLCRTVSEGIEGGTA